MSGATYYAVGAIRFDNNNFTKKRRVIVSLKNKDNSTTDHKLIYTKDLPYDNFILVRDFLNDLIQSSNEYLDRSDVVRINGDSIEVLSIDNKSIITNIKFDCGCLGKRIVEKILK